MIGAVASGVQTTHQRFELRRALARCWPLGSAAWVNPTKVYFGFGQGKRIFPSRNPVSTTSIPPDLIIHSNR